MGAAIEARRCCVGQFFRNGSRPSSVEGFGSFVIVTHADEMLLLTAGHVATGISEAGLATTIRLGEKAVALEQVRFAVDQHLDFALTRVQEIPGLQQYVDEKIDKGCIPSTDEIRLEGHLPPLPELAALLGFPGTRNKLDIYRTTTNPYLLNIIADGVSSEKQPEHQAFYAFSRKKLKAPMPNGMSGGPVFRIFYDEDQRKWRTLLKAILTEHVDGHRFVATRLSSALRLG